MAKKHVNAGAVVRKADLPSKPCAACGRPFAWRRKWAATWEEVRFCSDRCRTTTRASNKHQIVE